MSKDCWHQRGPPRPARGNQRGRGFYRGSPRGSARVNVCAIRGPVVPTTVIQKCDVGVQSEKEEPSTWEFSDHPTVKAVCAKPLLPPVQIFPLQFVTVDVAGYVCTALNDSGCQIPVVSERKFDWSKDGAVSVSYTHLTLPTNREV